MPFLSALSFSQVVEESYTPPKKFSHEPFEVFGFASSTPSFVSVLGSYFIPFL